MAVKPYVTQLYELVCISYRPKRTTTSHSACVQVRYLAPRTLRAAPGRVPVMIDAGADVERTFASWDQKDAPGCTSHCDSVQQGQDRQTYVRLGRLLIIALE